MARMARVVVPDIPHHVTQRGNRRQQVFFYDSDYLKYIELLSQFCKKSGTEVWAYCLMPNHVHLVMVPRTRDGLHRALAETHRRYTRLINFRENWRGYLWQGRFSSFPMDEKYLHAAVRYVELNPVRAGLCKYPTQWQWSSTNAHMSGVDDQLVRVKPMLERVKNWGGYLDSREEDEFAGEMHRHASTGRPLGSDSFVTELEEITDRCLKPQRSGRKRKKDTLHSK